MRGGGVVVFLGPLTLTAIGRLICTLICEAPSAAQAQPGESRPELLGLGAAALVILLILLSSGRRRVAARLP